MVESTQDTPVDARAEVDVEVDNMPMPRVYLHHIIRFSQYNHTVPLSGQIERKQCQLTIRLKIFNRTNRFRSHMAVIAHPHFPHVLALFVGGVVAAGVFVGIVVFE